MTERKGGPDRQVTDKELAEGFERSARDGHGFDLLTDAEWERAVERGHRAARKYKDLDVGALAEEGARQYQEEQEVKKKTERKPKKIPEYLVVLVLLVVIPLTLYLIFR